MNKNIRFKTSVLRSDLFDHSDVYIAATGIDRLAAATNEMIKLRKILCLKIMFNLDHTFQKLTVH